MNTERFIHVTDVTLRDGSYGIMHQYTKEQVASITRGLADAGVKIIEVGHGDGVGGSTITYGKSLLTDEEMFRTAADNKGNSELQLVCIPGVGTMDDIKRAQANGVTWVKPSIHATESDVMEQHIRQCKKIGMKVAALLSSSQAGNAQTEVLVGCLQRNGYKTSVDFYKIMDVAENLVEPVLTRPQVIRNMALVIGYVGTYGSFLIHAEKAGKKYGLDPRDIIAELGRRGMVMGQEDMIVDIAYHLAKQKEQQKNNQ